MPIYEYVCDQCEKKFEYLQSINDKPLKRVPNGEEPCGNFKCKAKCVRIASAPRYNKRQGQSNVKTDRTTGSTQTEHWDGRKDASIKPRQINMGLSVNRD